MEAWDENVPVVVPAQAGVFRRGHFRHGRGRRGPRAGGGVPKVLRDEQEWYEWSPRRRGCSGCDHVKTRAVKVVPAQAGVFRRLILARRR